MSASLRNDAPGTALILRCTPWASEPSSDCADPRRSCDPRSSGSRFASGAFASGVLASGAVRLHHGWLGRVGADGVLVRKYHVLFSSGELLCFDGPMSAHLGHAVGFLPVETQAAATHDGRDALRLHGGGEEWTLVAADAAQTESWRTKLDVCVEVS